jgi:hypothetical protein
MAEREKPAKPAPSRQVRAVIDRIEDNDLAVLLIGDEGKIQLDVPLDLLPEGASDGDHLRLTFALDKASTEETKARVKNRQDKLAQAGGAEEQKDFKL